jgi:hypothetical protein
LETFEIKSVRVDSITSKDIKNMRAAIELENGVLREMRIYLPSILGSVLMVIKHVEVLDKVITFLTDVRSYLNKEVK